MKIILAIVIILFIIGLICIICSCIVSAESSRKEEYRMLDPKELDDEFKFEDILEYNDTFIKKDRKKNEKRDNF